MPLGMEVGLRPDHIVLDGDPALSFTAKKRVQQCPTFRPVSIVAGWMDQAATWYGDSPSLTR